MKYLSLFLVAFSLILLTEGCVNPVKLLGIDNLWKSKEDKVKDEQGFTSLKKGKKVKCPVCGKIVYIIPDEKEKSKVHTYATLNWGVSIGGLIIILSAVAMGFSLVNRKQGIGGIVSGVLVLLACYFLTQFLVPLLYGTMILLIAGVSYILYINKEVIKAAVRFGNAMKEKADVDDEEIHKIADETQPKSVQKVLNPIVKKVA